MKVEKVQNYKILIVEDDRGLAQGIAWLWKRKIRCFYRPNPLRKRENSGRHPLRTFCCTRNFWRRKRLIPRNRYWHRFSVVFTGAGRYSRRMGLESDCTWHGKFCRRRMAISKWNPSREREAHLAYLFQNCKISERIWKEQNCILPYTKR